MKPPVWITDQTITPEVLDAILAEHPGEPSDTEVWGRPIPKGMLFYGCYFTGGPLPEPTSGEQPPADSGTGADPCPQCDGTGEVTYNTPDQGLEDFNCPTCTGTGRARQHPPQGADQ